jgi:hypothetical protein
MLRWRLDWLISYNLHVVVVVVVRAASLSEVMISRSLDLLGFRKGKSPRLGMRVRQEDRREDWRWASLREVEISN